MQLSPEQFHTLFDRAAQPVLLVQDGVITQCSSRAEELIAPGSPIRELLPPLPAGVMPSYIQYLDIIHMLEKKDIPVKISVISDALNIP